MDQSPAQLSLLEWTPPEPTVRFDEVQVRAATIEARVSRAIAAALKDSVSDRQAVAEAMGEFLGQRVTKNMLDAYASVAREDHPITIARFVALLHATRDRRLLELIAEPLGWAVIDRKMLPLIELAAVQEKQRELHAQADALRRRAKGVI